MGLVMAKADANLVSKAQRTVMIARNDNLHGLATPPRDFIGNDGEKASSRAGLTKARHELGWLIDSAALAPGQETHTIKLVEVTTYLGDFDQLIIVIMAIEEWLLSEDHACKHSMHQRCPQGRWPQPDTF